MMNNTHYFKDFIRYAMHNRPKKPKYKVLWKIGNWEMMDNLRWRWHKRFQRPIFVSNPFDALTCHFAGQNNMKFYYVFNTFLVLFLFLPLALFREVIRDSYHWIRKKLRKPY